MQQLNILLLLLLDEELLEFDDEDSFTSSPASFFSLSQISHEKENISGLKGGVIGTNESKSTYEIQRNIKKKRDSTNMKRIYEMKEDMNDMK